MAFDDLLSLFGGQTMGGNLFGAPQASQLYDNLPVPGVPQMGGQPGGILNENPVQMAGPGVPAAPPAGPVTKIFSEPPPPRTVAVDPDRHAPALGGQGPIPNAGGGPDERTAAPAPIVPPKIDLTKPGSSGTTVGGQAAPPPVGAPAAAPAPAVAAPAGPGGPGMLERLNKAVAGMPAMGGQQQPLHPASIGSAGQPHIPQGGAQLMQQLLEAQQKAMPVPGKVPSIGGVLGRRVQGLI